VSTEVIRFPETALTEWKIVADAANAERELRERIERETLVEREVERLRIRHQATLSFQQELDADQTPALEMATLATYQTNPAAAPVDMIDGVVKSDGLCIMLGPSGSGKSTVALQMLHSLASGADWLGQKVQQISGGAGIMSYDMDASMVMDWMSGFPSIDPNKVSVVNAYKRGNPLGVPQMRAEIAAAWRAMNTEVVIIDSFSASFFGHDQNDAAATMHHYRDLKLFALTEVGARSLVVIVHSTEGSPHKARGSSVHHDVADTIVSVAADQQGQRSIRMVKYRAARGQSQMNPVVVTAPDNVTHLVQLDLAAMTLAGMQLPAGAAAAAFTAMPETYEDPDTDSDSDEEDDDL
jgi:archaellum biogenesis ATPase FlaH